MRASLRLPVFVPEAFDPLKHSLYTRSSKIVDEEALRQDLANEQWIRERRGEPAEARVLTLYKRKADKVRPVDTKDTDGSAPGGLLDWRARAIQRERATGIGRTKYKYDKYIQPRHAQFARGTRLTPDRLDKMLIGDFLSAEEKDVLVEILYNREGVLSWEFGEIGKVRAEVAPPQEIRTIDHKPWQAASFPIPKALEAIVVELVMDRVHKGIYEPCHGPCRNPFFLVKKKKPGEYRIVNAAMGYNRVTIRDANLPPSADDFAEEFAGMHILSLVDWFSGYDQVELAENSRDMTAFMTPIGLMRCTTLPQGATNSVAQFCRITNKILEHQIPERARPFLDDIAVKGPKTDYSQEELLPGVRRFVMEHLQNLDAVLCDVERSGATISGEKSQFCMEGIQIVGYVCDREGRHPQTAKIEKIITWPTPTNPKELRGFLGICVYYRIWVKGFAFRVAIFYRLLKKNVVWIWTEEHDLAMNDLKGALTTTPALVSIDYSPGAGKVILSVDASFLGWGAVLQQLERLSKKRHPVRYESGVWSKAESEYDALKRETRGLLKALKKFKRWLYGIRFVVETDAMTLAAQLNRQATDLPGALVTQWLAWIRLFDFEVRHVAGNKNVVADSLSRRPPTEEDLAERERELDIDEWIEAQLGPVRGSLRPIVWSARGEDLIYVRPVRVSRREIPEEVPRVIPLWEGEYTEESKTLAKYLQDLQRPAGMNNNDFRKLQKDALNYFTRDGHLFRRPGANRPSRRVVDNDRIKLQILQALHDDAGHRGRESTNQRIADRYFWEGQWKDVKEFIKTCEECQLREGIRLEEEMYPTYVDRRWYQVHVDCTPMPNSQGKKYLVEARSNFSGWVEARGIASCDSAAVSKFLWEEIICRHGMFGKLVVDGGPENKKLVSELAERYNTKRVVTSAYHPQANGIVEVGHRGIANSLSKMTTATTRKDWMNHLHAVLWADRTTVKSSTGCTPYEIEFVDRPILPIELEISTWNVLQWDRVVDTADLVAMRARALERRNEDLEEAAAHLRRMRELGKKYFDERHRLRTRPLEVGMLVLSHDTAGSMNMSAERKLAFRWFGPYRIVEADVDKGTYTLSELDGAMLRGTYAGNRLKQFFPRAADFFGGIEEGDFAGDQGSETDEEPVGTVGPFTYSHQGEVQAETEGESFQDAAPVGPRRSARFRQTFEDREKSEPQRSQEPQTENRVANSSFWVEIPTLTAEQKAKYSGLRTRGESVEDEEEGE